MLGWEPTCTCPEAPPVPCRVLDPFGGSGTTSAVADALGRDGYHADISGEYLDLAPARTEDVRRILLGKGGRATIQQDASGALVTKLVQPGLFGHE